MQDYPASPEVTFSHFVKDKKILLLDSQQSSRTGLAKVLCEMGTKVPQLIIVDSLQWAEKAIQEQNPEILFIEASSEGNRGFEFLQSVRNQDLEKSIQGKRLSILLTKNASHAFLAQAAEGDVDLVIPKPFTLEKLKKDLTTIATLKEQPPLYLQEMKKGQDTLFQSKARSAMAREHFSKAAELTDKPSMAYYYTGFTYQLDNDLEKASHAFHKGLDYQKNHFKCLWGLYQTLTLTHRNQEAYKVLRQLIQHFPLSSSRLIQGIRWAIEFDQFDDVLEYHPIFLQIEPKSAELIKAMCAGLLVTGKRAYLKGSPATSHAPRSGASTEDFKAIDIFLKVAISSGNEPRFLHSIVEFLISHNELEAAEKFLSRFPLDQRNKKRIGADYASLFLYLLSKTKPEGAALQYGFQLIKQEREEHHTPNAFSKPKQNEEHHDPLLYRVLIELCEKAGHKDTAAALKMDYQRIYGTTKMH